MQISEHWEWSEVKRGVTSSSNCRRVGVGRMREIIRGFSWPQNEDKGEGEQLHSKAHHIDEILHTCAVENG